ncbi:MAG: amino acid permease [Lactobacillus sp.]|nr:amino acid permease [Lactobacillus sp.]MCH4068314.1 amino acid permease [Lactobacillus sp.]MCI1304573.1 amino acid permease [Lactobacillus sp.]MCI1330665.1 amino acid permease [Lactobacillus sp.]MCI1359820.1 amino acid permease [Lactobacillus sp.]
MAEKDQTEIAAEDQKYNRLTGLKLFAMTSSMVISVDELAPFGKTGAASLFYLLLAGIIWFIPITQIAGEMASINGWEKGGVFTWVKGPLGDKTGWTAMFYQWLHITVGMDTMMYVIIGALSIALGTPWFNTNPWVRFGLMMLILWGATAAQLLGAKRVGRIAEVLFAIGIATPVVLLVIVFCIYLVQGHPLYIHLNWNTIIPHQLNQQTLVAFVPFVLAFCGGEASAPHVKNLDDQSKYPKVMWALALTAICFDLLGSLAVGMSVPKSQIQNSTGFVYTYGHLLTTVGLPGFWLEKVIGVLLACGITGEIASWLAGPNQGLYEAAKEGYMPHFFVKTTRRNVPIRVVVLQSLIVTASAVLITFTSGANADFAFNVSLAATTAQYLMAYVLLLLAYLVLKHKHEDWQRSYYLSCNKTFSMTVAVVALLITVVAFFISFIPAQGTPARLRGIYVWTMIGLCLLVTVLPLVLYHWHGKWKF